MLLEILGFFLGISGTSLTLVTILFPWFRQKFPDARTHLLVQLDQKYQAFKRMEGTEQKKKLREFLKVGNLLNAEDYLDTCTFCCQIGVFLCTVASGLILVKLSTLLSNLILLALVEIAIGVFGTGSIFFFSIFYYHSFVLGFRLKSL